MSAAYERLVDALRADGRDVKERGDAAMAQCPAHADNNGSLSIRHRRDGDGIVLYCHASCDTAAVLAALGLGFRDLYDAPRTATVRPVQRRQRRAAPTAPTVVSTDRLQLMVDRYGTLTEAGRGRAETWNSELCAACRTRERLHGPQWWSQFCEGCATSWAPAEDIAEQLRWNAGKQAAVAISQASNWSQVAQSVRSRKRDGGVS